MTEIGITNSAFLPYDNDQRIHLPHRPLNPVANEVQHVADVDDLTVALATLRSCVRAVAERLPDPAAELPRSKTYGRRVTSRMRQSLRGRVPDRYHFTLGKIGAINTWG